MEVNIDAQQKPKNFFKAQGSARKAGNLGGNHELMDIFDQEIDIIDHSES
jgi:hypothetical protein